MPTPEELQKEKALEDFTSKIQVIAANSPQVGVPYNQNHWHNLRYGVCPNCGYCPCCGRSNSPYTSPYNPWGTQITWGGLGDLTK